MASSERPNCLGIPVIYKPKLSRICESRGIWRFKRIVVGPSFTRFPPREQQALLLHEAGHCKLFHVEKRILNMWRLVFWPSSLLELCKKQELEADGIAAGCGYGPDLIRAFFRIREVNSPFHPSISLRIEKLMAYPN